MTSIAARLFAFTTLLVAVTMGLAIGISSWMGNAVGDEAVERSLRSSVSVQRGVAERNRVQLELMAQLVASDPAFSAYVAQASAGASLPGVEVDRSSISDLLRERDGDYGFAFSAVIGADGFLIARSDQPDAVARDMRSAPLVAAALRELVPVSGYWAESRSLYQAAVVPISRGGNLVGLLLIATIIDDALAEEIADVSGAELVFIVRSSRETFAVAATLEDAVASAIPKILARDVDTIVPVRLGNAPWATSITSLGSAGPDTTAELAALVSIDAVLAPTRQLRNVLLGVGIVILAAAMFFAFVFARAAVRPLHTLSAAADDAVSGEFANTISASGTRELRQLESSFNRLVSDLREERSLEKSLLEMLKSPDTVAQDKQLKVPAIPSGTLVNERFEVQTQIGEGGAGVVYRALDRELGELVVLKMLRPEVLGDPSNVERVKSEIRVTRRITHPNVVRVHDLGNYQDRPFISMEFVRGFTLRQILNHYDRLPLDAGIRVIRQTCQGLRAAHEAGVVHRDIKPENIIVQFDATTKLMDFGIARPVTSARSGADDGFVEGTAYYLSPEQIRGDTADRRTDIYALGVVMMEIFTGHHPHSGDTDDAICLAHLSEPATRPSEFWSQIPNGLESIIMRCLEKLPKDRFEDVDALTRELEALR